MKITLDGVFYITLTFLLVSTEFNSSGSCFDGYRDYTLSSTLYSSEHYHEQAQIGKNHTARRNRASTAQLAVLSPFRAMSTLSLVLTKPKPLLWLLKR
jgi:hypothetical protein